MKSFEIALKLKFSPNVDERRIKNICEGLAEKINSVTEEFFQNGEETLAEKDELNYSIYIKSHEDFKDGL